MQTEKPLKGQQLATLCKVSLRTVESWRRRNMGPPYIKLSNGTIRYPAKEAYSFATAYTGQPLEMEEA